MLRKSAPSGGNTTDANSGPISDSPESMYEWIDGGTVMGKKVENSEKREGYVILKDGTRHDGELRLRKKDGVIVTYIVRAEGKKKQKGKMSKVARYGYTVSEEEVKQENLEELADDFYAGSVETADGTFSGEVSQVNIMGKFYAKQILLKDAAGKLSEYDTKTVTSFTQNVKGETKTYIVFEDVFIEEEFNGNTFQLFRNPNPTSTNKFLTGLVKETVAIGSNALAQEIARKDAKNNNYTTNMDSIIGVSTPEQLMAIRDGFAKLGGYNTYQEALDKSDNESLKNNINAIELALAGNKIRNSEGGLLNKEWIILNKATGEKTVVYRGDYKNRIEPLLKGCYEYLSLDRGDQRQFEKWRNLQKTVKMLDGCY
ncbi:MAG: hypothetical protein AB8B65_11360 [Kordia sp.]|uniref:hypothetical protein n=1 Tax=Kordia sp. TaxID=1965332 RepID=UPI00385CAF43